MILFLNGIQTTILFPINHSLFRVTNVLFSYPFLFYYWILALRLNEIIFEFYLQEQQTLSGTRHKSPTRGVQNALYPAFMSFSSLPEQLASFTNFLSSRKMKANAIRSAVDHVNACSLSSKMKSVMALLVYQLIATAQIVHENLRLVQKSLLLIEIKVSQYEFRAISLQTVERLKAKLFFDIEYIFISHYESNEANRSSPRKKIPDVIVKKKQKA